MPIVFKSALEGALWMAETHGVPVFPLRPNSKKPYADEGVSIATTDPVQIRKWFADRPGMNYGCATTDRVVLDVDTKHGAPGFATLDTVGALPRTLIVATPTGGLHIYFEGYDAGQSPFGAGVDVRSRGGYVVGPGSTIDGKPYVVSDDQDIAPVPENVVDRLSEPGKSRAKPTDVRPLCEMDTDPAIARAVAYLETRPGAPEGSRNTTGFQVACTLKDYGLSPGVVASLMLQHWADKCDPPIGDFEVEKLAQNAWQSGQNPPGVLHPSADFGDIDPSALPEIEAPDDAEAEDAPDEDAKIAATDWCKSFKAWDTDFDIATLQARQWVVAPFLLRHNLTALLAGPGAGKSALALGFAVAVALGSAEAVGFTTPASQLPGKVLFLTTEESGDELNRRLLAYCAANSIDRSQLAGRIYILSDDGDDSAKLMVVDRKTGQMRMTDTFRRAYKLVKEQNIDLVILDPFVELHDAEENDNSAIAGVVQRMRKLCRKTGCAGLVPHHTRKAAAGSAGQGAGDQNSARGAGAFLGAVRIAATLTTASEDDALRLGLEPHERRDFVRLDYAKGNPIKGSSPPRWYQHREMFLPIPEAHEEGQSVGALVHVDVSARLDSELRKHFEALLPVLENAGGSGMKIADAAKYLSESRPGDFGAKVPALSKALRLMFGAPKSLAGYTIEAVGVGQAARLVLSGAAADDFSDAEPDFE